MSGFPPNTVYRGLLDLLPRLDEHRVPERPTTARPQAVIVRFALPGERWEVEFPADGAVAVERLRSEGAIEGESALDELWEIVAEDED